MDDTETEISNFIPTCSECSTTYPAPGVVSVRGESSMAVCRECHRKMSKLYLTFLSFGTSDILTRHVQASKYQK